MLDKAHTLGNMETTIMKRFFSILFLFSMFFGWADDGRILTASEFFQSVSDNYAALSDFEAVLRITQNRQQMEGQFFLKYPDKILINFNEPKDQVVSVNGTVLTIYLPRESVTLIQNLSRGGETARGLSLFVRGYNIAWVSSATPVPLEDGSPEMVRKLRLTWKNTDEGFREIEISVGQNGFIRRMVGITKNYEELRMDFRNIRVNQNIPDSRFEYTGPSSSFKIHNFIYSEE